MWLALSLCAHGATVDAMPVPADDLEQVLVDVVGAYPGALTLPEAPPMYHLRYQLMIGAQTDIRSSLGSLVYEDHSPLNLLGVEVRLGTPAFDNMGFGGWQDGLGRARLPAAPTAHAVQVVAWELTDTAFKEAVEQFARKTSQVPERAEHPGDYTLTGPVVFADPLRPTVAPEGLVALATELSSAWTGASVLDRGDVYVGHEAGTVWTVDSEGTRVSRPVQETTVRAAAHLRTPDGEMLTDQVLWTVRAPSELPEAAVMRAQIQAARDRLAAVAAAKPLAEEYVGPVLFEDLAANDFFRFLLPQQLEGTPQEIPFDTWFGDLGTDQESVRVGRRVLPPGWSVVDDPRRPGGHPGTFTHDWEGTPAVPLALVSDGIVRTLAMSRTPRKGLLDSNGHGRGAVGRRAEGRVTMLEVTASRQVSEAKLRKTALKAARAYGHDYVLVVRRLQVPAVQNLSRGGGLLLFGGDEAAALPPPIDVVRLYADGREERIRGASFSGVQRFLLRDVLAAGPTKTSSAMQPMSGDWGDLGPTQGFASWMSTPTVLIGEMELVPQTGDVRDVPVLPVPE